MRHAHTFILCVHTQYLDFISKWFRSVNKFVDEIHANTYIYIYIRVKSFGNIKLQQPKSDAIRSISSARPKLPTFLKHWNMHIVYIYICVSVCISVHVYIYIYLWMCLGFAHQDEISFEIDRELHSQIIPKLQHALFLLFWCFLNLPLCGLRDDGLRVFP